jgi:hypothetical protein
LNKLLIIAASAGILYGGVAASPQGLPYMLEATTDRPSSVNQQPSRGQNADQANPNEPQLARPAEPKSPESSSISGRSSQPPRK